MKPLVRFLLPDLQLVTVIEESVPVVSGYNVEEDEQQTVDKRGAKQRRGMSKHKQSRHKREENKVRNIRVEDNSQLEDSIRKEMVGSPSF